MTDESLETIKDPSVKSDVISHRLVHELNPNVVYIEGGLFANDHGMWRIPQKLAQEICDEGGVVIIADVDHNEWRDRKEQYQSAAHFLGAFASYGKNDPEEPIYAADEHRCWRGVRQILCDPKKMIIDDWIRPVYKEIPEILVGLPIKLASWGSIVASCNSDTTGTLLLDRWVDQPDVCPIGSAAQRGNGFVVVISGNVSGDAWLEGCPHNVVWLTRLAEFIAQAGQADRARRLTHLRSPYSLFLSHRSMDKAMVSEVAKHIKNRGIRVWIDEQQLVPSQSLVVEVDRALSNMTHFVLFWSANCVGAPWVERELAAAVAVLIEKSVPLIIARLDSTPVPSIVQDLFRIECLDQEPTAIAAQIQSAVDRLARHKKWRS